MAWGFLCLHGVTNKGSDGWDIYLQRIWLQGGSIFIASFFLFHRLGIKLYGMAFNDLRASKQEQRITNGIDNNHNYIIKSFVAIQFYPFLQYQSRRFSLLLI